MRDADADDAFGTSAPDSRRLGRAIVSKTRGSEWMRPAVYKHWDERTGCDRYRVGSAELAGPRRARTSPDAGAVFGRHNAVHESDGSGGAERTTQTYQADGCRRPYAVPCARFPISYVTQLWQLEHAARRRGRTPRAAPPSPIDSAAHRIGVTTATTAQVLYQHTACIYIASPSTLHKSYRVETASFRQCTL